MFVGLVVRDHLMVLLRQALGRSAGGQLSYSDLNRRYVSSAAQRIITEQQMAVLQANLCHQRAAARRVSGCHTASLLLVYDMYARSVRTVRQSEYCFAVATAGQQR